MSEGSLNLPRPRPTFSDRLRENWAPLAILIAALAAGGGLVAKATGLFAPRTEVIVAEDRIRLLEQSQTRQEVRLDNLEHGQSWLQETVFSMAARQGLHPAPTPVPQVVPRPSPSPSPRSSP